MSCANTQNSSTSIITLSIIFKLKIEANSILSHANMPQNFGYQYNTAILQLQHFETEEQAKLYLYDNSKFENANIIEADLCAHDELCQFDKTDIVTQKYMPGGLTEFYDIILKPDIYNDILDNMEFEALYTDNNTDFAIIDMSERDAYFSCLEIAEHDLELIQNILKTRLDKVIYSPIRHQLAEQLRYLRNISGNHEQTIKLILKLLSKNKTIVQKRFIVDKLGRCTEINKPMLLERLASRKIAQLVDILNVNKLPIPDKIKEQIKMDLYFKSKLALCR